MELPGYHDIATLAEGGMAVLYRGIQTSLGRPVAIKVLKEGFAGEGLVRNLFEREASIIARLDHPNIIRVIDRGETPAGVPYFVMEYVEGQTLRDLIHGGAIPHGERVRIVLQIAKALAYAHKNSIVHRDIKPGNILIDRDGNARVVDFGISLLTGDADAPPHPEEASTLLGTDAWMAPEQRKGAQHATSASDMFSLGVILYRLFAGTMPPSKAPPVSRFNPGLAPALDALISRCLETEPVQRPTAEALVNALLEVNQGAHLTALEVKGATEALDDPKKKFVLLDVIRETPFSSVYLYENRSNRALMVLKKRAGNYDGFREADLFFRVPHPNVVKIHGVSRNERIFIVIMDYLSGGSLQARMANPLFGDDFSRIAEQICDAMSFAHQHKVVHGNLRPHNVLFDAAGVVKVTDFGMGRHYQTTFEKDWYSIEGEPPSIKGDIFSAGVMFHQMLTGEFPKWNGDMLVESASFKALTTVMRALLKDMLMRDAASRIGSFEIVRARLRGKRVRPDVADEATRASVTDRASELPEPSEASSRRSRSGTLFTASGGMSIEERAAKVLQEEEAAAQAAEAAAQAEAEVLANDTARAEALVALRAKRRRQLMVAALLFGSGWALGRFTAPDPKAFPGFSPAPVEAPFEAPIVEIRIKPPVKDPAPPEAPVGGDAPPALPPAPDASSDASDDVLPVLSLGSDASGDTSTDASGDMPVDVSADAPVP